MFTIEYLEVVQQDLKSISKPDRLRIRDAIEKKLKANPIEFGKPLQYSLKGLRRLRVGNYRVIFQINPSNRVVLIVSIGHRKSIYE